jgi:Asp-tRNA(Asn)/Glu-tRNA(Gln) amidotransferase A subunit family amidase
VRGYPTTWGASPYRDQSFDYDATVVEKLDAAGAILVAKLTMGALAQGDRWFGGMTRNPWNPEQGSSGSSAGPGAATAAGLVGFAHWHGDARLDRLALDAQRRDRPAPDVRPCQPARRDGAVVEHGQDRADVPQRRGLCARVRRDARPDGRDPTVRDVPFNWDAERPLSELRVGYNRAAFEQTNNAEGERNRYDDAALEALMRIVPDLTPVDMPTQQYPLGAIQSAVLGVEAAAAFDELTRSGRDELMVPEPERSSWPNTFRTARFVPAVEYINANRVRTLSCRRWTMRCATSTSSSRRAVPYCCSRT